MSVFNQIFGRKPVVPNLPALDLGTEQQQAIKNNLAALPGAQDLVSKANLFSRQQIDQMLSSVMPNFGAIKGNISHNIADLTTGKIPGDVSDAVQNSAAARSLGGGFGGSGMARDLVARDLGMTSLNLTQRGLADAESWMKTAESIYGPSMMNVTSMFVSPSQQVQFDVSEREAQFQRQWMQNQITAMPDPVMRGIHDTIMSLADAYLGGTYTEGMKPGDYGKTSGGVGTGPHNNPSSPDQYNQDEAAYFNAGGNEGLQGTGSGGGVEGDFGGGAVGGTGFGGGFGGFA